MDGNDPRPVQELRLDLKAALRLDDETERLLDVVAIVSESVADLGITPVVVGGLAVQYWTFGQYMTGDVDLLMPHHGELDARLAALGFEREGRHWVLRKGQIFVEAPGSFPAEHERTLEVSSSTGSRWPVAILSPEDLVLWRLREVVHWRYRDAVRQAVLLLGASDLDHVRLATRAEKESLQDALSAVQELATRAGKGGQLDESDLEQVVARVGKRPV